MKLLAVLRVARKNCHKAIASKCNMDRLALMRENEIAKATSPTRAGTAGKRIARPSKLIPLCPGSRSDAAGKAVSNVILLSLPDKEYNLLRPHLEPVDLPQYEILEEPGRKIECAYFLNDGMISLVALSRDGRSVEVGIVGKEGMVGMSLIAGLQQGTFRASMQMAGTGMRIRARVFQDILLSAPALRAELSRFALMHGMQSSARDRFSALAALPLSALPAGPRPMDDNGGHGHQYAEHGMQ